MLFELFLVIIINLFGGLTLHAQECAETYENISRSCVEKNQNKLKENYFEIKNNLQDSVYFYQTSTGDFGKFIVKSAFSSKEECTLYIEAVTYTREGSYNPPNTFSIKSEYGAWTSETINLNKTGDPDFILKNNNNKCYLVTNKGKAFFYQTMTDNTLLMGSEILYYASLVLIALAVFLVANSIFKDEDAFKAQEKLEEAEASEKEAIQKKDDFVLRVSRPFFKRYLTPIVMGMKGKKKIRDKYKRKLASGGLTKSLNPEDLYAFKLFLILGFPIAFLAVRQFLEADWPIVLTPIMGVVGFFYPDIWLNGKIEKRKEEVIMAMPFIVDMLALSVEAGLDFMAAMQKVIDKAPPSALVEEFEQLIKETRIGASRAEGLRQLAWRIDSLPVSSFCATLIAADSVGASIGPILKTLSAELRQKRSADAEKKGATAATKILFPMMMFILPAVMIIIGAPLVLQMFN
jgi:tight adherence protein C